MIKARLQTLQAMFEGSASVVAGIAEIEPFVAAVLPVVNDDLSLLTVQQRIASIALLKRFEQLEDQIQKIARLILALDTEPVDRMSHRDIANRMEKLAIVEDADGWLDLRELRNNLVHEYPIGASERADRVNECWALTPTLIKVVDRLRSVADSRGHLA